MGTFSVLISMVGPGKRYVIGKECVFNHLKKFPFPVLLSPLLITSTSF